MGSSKLSYIDLPRYLGGVSGATDMTLIGVLSGFIHPPKGLHSLTYGDDVVLGRLDLVGVEINLSSGVLVDVKRYLAVGTVPIVVPPMLAEAYKKKSSGKLAITVRGNVKLGRTLSSKGGFNENSDNPLDAMVVGFRRYLKGNIWCAKEFPTELLSKDKYPEFYNLLLSASTNNWLLHDLNDSRISQSYVKAGKGTDFEALAIDGKLSKVSNVEKNNQGGMEVEPNYLTSNIANQNLGLSGELPIPNKSQDSISNLLKNRSVNKTVVESRSKVLPFSKDIKELEKVVAKSKRVLDKFKKSVKGLPESDVDDAIRYMSEGLSEAWDIYGKALFEKSMLKLIPDREKEITTLITIMGSSILKSWSEGESLPDNKGLDEILTFTRLSIYIDIIDSVIGMRGKLNETYSLCAKDELNILTILHNNPYILGLINPQIGIENLIVLASVFGITESKNVNIIKNAVHTHMYMLNSDNRGIGTNTTIKKNYLKYSVKSGLILNKAMYTTLQATGQILLKDKIEMCRNLFAPTIKPTYLAMPTSGWREYYLDGTVKYVKETQEGSTFLTDYINSGLGVEFEKDGVSYISDYILAKKEIYVYKKLHEMSSENKIKKDVKLFDSVISKFEAEKSSEYGIDFKLETNQKLGLDLLLYNCGCLTGGAGTGKTTTAELLVYGLEMLLNCNEGDIVYVAPTGRSATRLREVVKRKTRTIHSYFGIKDNRLSLFDKGVKDEDIRNDIKVVIADEMSMVNINLMYDMLSKIGNEVSLYMIGDKDQLPPIGFGKPFVTALRFLPTTVLNVGKRAVDGNTLYKNFDTLLNTYNTLDNTDDFRIDKVTIDNTVESVVNICRYHLGIDTVAKDFLPIKVKNNIDYDDIQVISPINKGVWGIKNLNRVLQGVFNRENTRSVTYQKGTDFEVKFKIGDRVIHTDNHPDTLRFEKQENGSYALLDEDMQMGVMNGDIGKVKDIIYSFDLDLEFDSKYVKKYYPKKKNRYYLAVEYKDINVDTNEVVKFIVFYGFDSVTNTMHMDAMSYTTHLSSLDLAYALTCHKLQGSEAKLVINVLHKVRVKGFISRNMIYTGVSRAKEGVYLIGDVVGYSSALTEGRKIEQSQYIDSIVDKLLL